MTTWDWIKVVLVVTAVISLTEILGIRLAAAGQERAKISVGITILPSASNPARKGVKASPDTTSSTPTRCPKQDSTGTINLQGQTWAC